MRTVTTGRVWMRLISWQVLDQYMQFRGETNTSLAEKAGISRQIIGFLRTGRRTTCRPSTAYAIAEALEVLPESLFMAEVAIAQVRPTLAPRPPQGRRARRKEAA